MEPKKKAFYPHLTKEDLLGGKLRPNSENRVWAKMTDLALIQLAGYLSSYFFAILSVPLMGLLWALCDRANGGQSPGKWLFGLHTIESRRGSKPKHYQSFVRNIAFFSLNIGVLFLSSFLGKFFFLVGFACLSFELYCVFQVRSGVRVGDIVGSTRVFDFKDEHTKFIEQFLKENKSEHSLESP